MTAITACVSEPEPPDPPLAPPLASIAPAVRVEVAVAELDGEASRSTELRGLVTALVELGLSDLEGVVPVVPGAPPSPSLAAPLQTGTTTWTLDLTVGVAGDVTRVDAQLCRAPEDCVAPLTGSGPTGQAWLAVAPVLEGAAVALGRPTTEELRRGWRTPLSDDPYAVLLCGRAGAVSYGLLDPATGAAVGDIRRDPLDRAVRVDPSIAPAAWLLSRRDALRGEPERARVPLPRARIARPWSVVLLAEDAALQSRIGTSRRSAALAWERVGRAAPDDVRFVLPRAEAALRVGDAERAAAVLDAGPRWSWDEAAVLALRVAIADAGDEGPGDPLLARWQQAAPDDPEPVRRRIGLRITRGAYREALELVPLLEARGEAEEAARLALPLALGAGQPDAARAAARALGLSEVVAALDARERLAADPTDVDAVSLADPAIRASVLLGADRTAEALEIVEALLADRPWEPDLLALQARALLRLGRDPEPVLARLRWADPAHPDLGGSSADR